ncbi:MAG: chemotaxis protein CheX [Magnetococcales bacterium]|nr:chemotaxis protein CheX [Magnetococcales bacterium]MBF0151408.1 chemotaxis protein CheX [Magnetococcales bacterium]MBF0174330.1 chemotaxis protein CheX [Magnetococcales bacterium]MBF0348193.1 chemotaxis protein CheX [Magnetococcales bacterium]MBF0632308.1 chemotaxis protein CheX [Magnetococcales bacterium]
MPDNRKHSRVVPPIDVSIHCDNGTVYRGVVNDISVAGVNIKISKVYDMGLCQEGLLKMKFGSHEDPYVAEFIGEVVRCDQNSITYKLKESDPNNFKLLKKTILDYAAHPKEVIDEIKFNPGLSLNSLYLPAMRDSILSFIQEAVKSIFSIYLETEVLVVSRASREVDADDVKISSVCGFNGALYGSIIVVSEIVFAKALVAKLLELEPGQVSMPTIIDGFGELSNMISGGVQSGLSEEYENISLIPPMVFVGHQCTYSSDQLFNVRADFDCLFGPFSVECFFSIV